MSFVEPVVLQGCLPKPRMMNEVDALYDNGTLHLLRESRNLAKIAPAGLCEIVVYHQSAKILEKYYVLKQNTMPSGITQHIRVAANRKQKRWVLQASIERQDEMESLAKALSALAHVYVTFQLHFSAGTYRRYFHDRHVRASFAALHGADGCYYAYESSQLCRIEVAIEAQYEDAFEDVIENLVNPECEV